MSWDKRLVFLNGNLLREYKEYIWRGDRIKVNIALSEKDHLTILTVPAHRVDYGEGTKDICRVVDPTQDWVP